MIFIPLLILIATILAFCLWKPKVLERYPHLIPLFTTVITISATVLGTVSTVGQTTDAQTQLETDKFSWQKDIAAAEIETRKKSEVDAAIVELANRVSLATYETGSFLESAKFHPDKLNEYFDRHEEKMKQLMADIVSSHASLAAKDKGPYELFLPLIKQISILDGALQRFIERLQNQLKSRRLKIFS